MKNTLIKTLTAALAGLVISASASALSFTVYTDRATWEAAVGSFSEETFDTASAGSPVVLADLTITAIGSGHSGFGVSGGELNDRLTSSNSTVFDFSPGSITAFGGNWDLRPGGAGLGIAVSGGGTTVGSQIPDSSSGGFWGIVADSAISSISLTGGTQGGVAETYDLDNLVYNSVPDNGSTLALLGLGLIGMVYARRRQS